MNEPTLSFYRWGGVLVRTVGLSRTPPPGFRYPPDHEPPPPVDDTPTPR